MKRIGKWILMVVSAVFAVIGALFLKAKFWEPPLKPEGLKDQEKKTQNAVKKTDEQIKETDKVKEDNDEELKKPVESIDDINDAIDYAKDAVSEYRSRNLDQ